MRELEFFNFTMWKLTLHGYLYKKVPVKCYENSESYQQYNELYLSFFLFSSIYVRRKYWIRENFRHTIFDGFTCFEMS